MTEVNLVKSSGMELSSSREFERSCIRLLVRRALFLNRQPIPILDHPDLPWGRAENRVTVLYHFGHELIAPLLPLWTSAKVVVLPERDRDAVAYTT